MNESIANKLWAEATPASRRVLAAAAHLFADKGYAATSTRDIAAAVGMSPAAVYVHYKNKGQLLEFMCRSALTSLLAAVTRSATDEAAPSVHARNAIWDYLAWHTHHPEVGYVAHHQFRALDDEHRPAIEELRRHVDTAVTRQISVAMENVDEEASLIVTKIVLATGVDLTRWCRTSPVTANELASSYTAVLMRLLPARSDDQHTRSSTSSAPLVEDW